ncbi:MAG: TldD/PmbA family protein [Candidatus Thorarchaeota archaeon]|nr:TldD/PmbA family protein [Candidatus Thorarchaeota archaeon]
MAGYEDLKTYVDVAVDYCKDKAEGIIARGRMSSGSQIRFSQNAIDIGKRWEELKLELFVIIEGAQTGYGEQSVTSEEEARKTVESTIAFAKRLPESMLFAGVEQEVRSYRAIDGAYDPKIDDFTVLAPGFVNSAIDAAVSEGAKRVAGALRFSKELSFFRSSYGPEGSIKVSSFDINVRAFQEELDYSGQGLECGTIPTRAEKGIIAAGAQAGRFSKEAVGAVQGTPGIYDLVLSPTVGANVLGGIPDSANPFLILIGMSPLADKIGEQIGSEFLTVTDDAWIPNGLASRESDFEGTPTQQTNIIENGVLKSFVHNTTTGKMHGTSSTGSSQMLKVGEGLKMLLPNSSNLVFENGNYGFEELVENSKPTIYVTSNWYTRFQNYQTGEFSTIPRDAMFLIANGEMKPIKNLRISDNTMRMFANVDAVGNDRKQIFWWEVPTPTFIPTVRVKDCRMSAATQ